MSSLLITARDLANRDACASVAMWMQMLAAQSIRRGRFSVSWDGQHIGGAPLQAFVDFGRWIARCDCGQHNYVDPDEPVCFCARCGNGNSGLARLVIFPDDRPRIEELLLARPVVKHSMAKNQIEGARLAKPVNPLLVRNWFPGQSVTEVHAMNDLYGGK